MPPRKSTSSIPPTDGEEGSAGMQSTEQQLKAQAEGVSVEVTKQHNGLTKVSKSHLLTKFPKHKKDLLLPRSVTQRLAKSVLPPNTTIQKDALLAIQKAATVFVSYLSSHANDATLKRTIAPSDVLSVLSELEFDSLHPRLERELEAHTEAQAGKKRATKEKKEAAASEGNPENASMVSTTGEAKGGDNQETGIREKKRVKRDSDGQEKTVPTTDDTEVEEEPDDDETEEAEDEDEDDEEEEEEESDGGDETQEAEDLDRVEGPDQRDRQVEANSDSEEDEDGPAAQLRSNMGLG
ncbi:uncharacterized protein TRUGW13939_03116 [Talaromyces rugulosus]|uniref:DNA polymerase epsilon subunit D n=1 Tax=Talaromyces rugulosus TaxID=121627 RepID=A0A7H8QQ80_TALRU|nr:uncharacterized protein TRUGW13939_03116 [Talaromyces rugulosus]QKX56016.1 hypothetical protein TRUGW13939_03116 [Talaromyces rugulosus]